jgi:hypothetical protein
MDFVTCLLFDLNDCLKAVKSRLCEDSIGARLNLSRALLLVLPHLIVGLEARLQGLLAELCDSSAKLSEMPSRSQFRPGYPIFLQRNHQPQWECIEDSGK